MAKHLRQQIREAIAAKLVGLTTTGSNVYQSRIYPLENGEMPCLLVSTGDEQIIGRSGGGLQANVMRVTQRRLEVIIKAKAKMVTNDYPLSTEDVDLDDRLDTICKEVEASLASDHFLITGGARLLDDLRLTGTRITMDDGSDQPTGEAVMEWEAIYWCREDTPDVKH